MCASRYGKSLHDAIPAQFLNESGILHNFKTGGITTVSTMPRTIESRKRCFKIIDFAKTFSQLKIKESFHIERLNPEIQARVKTARNTVSFSCALMLPVHRS